LENQQNEFVPSLNEEINLKNEININIDSKEMKNENDKPLEDNNIEINSGFNIIDNNDENKDINIKE